MKQKGSPHVTYEGEMLILDHFSERDCDLLLRNLIQSYEGRLIKVLTESKAWAIDFSKVNSLRAKAGKITYSLADVAHYVNQVWLRSNPVKTARKVK